MIEIIYLQGPFIYKAKIVLSIVIIPTPGKPSRADMLIFALFSGILIPVKLSKIFKKIRLIIPGIADFKEFKNGHLYFRIK